MNNWLKVMAETVVLIVEDVRDGWAGCRVWLRGPVRERPAWFQEVGGLTAGGRAQQGQ